MFDIVVKWCSNRSMDVSCRRSEGYITECHWKFELKNLIIGEKSENGDWKCV